MTQASVIQHIGLAGAVGSDHRVNAGGELKSGGGSERLEPAQGQRQSGATRGLSAEELVCAGHVLWCMAASL